MTLFASSTSVFISLIIVTITIISIIIIISSSSPSFTVAQCPILTPNGQNEIIIPDSFDGAATNTICPTLTIEGVTVRQIAFQDLTNVDNIIIKDITCSDSTEFHCILFQENKITNLKTLTISNITRPQVDLPTVEQPGGNRAEDEDFSTVMFYRVEFIGAPLDSFSITDLTVGRILKPSLTSNDKKSANAFSFVLFNTQAPDPPHPIRVSGDFIIDGLHMTGGASLFSDGDRMSLCGIHSASEENFAPSFVGTGDNARLIWKNIFLRDAVLESNPNGDIEAIGVLLEGSISGFKSVEMSNINIENVKMECGKIDTNSGCDPSVMGIKCDKVTISATSSLTFRDIHVGNTQIKTSKNTQTAGIFSDRGFPSVGESLLFENITIDGVQDRSFFDQKASKRVLAIRLEEGDKVANKSSNNNNNNNNNIQSSVVFNQIHVKNVALFTPYKATSMTIGAVHLNTDDGKSSSFVGFNQFNITHCSVSDLSLIGLDPSPRVEVVGMISSLIDDNRSSSVEDERSLFVQDLSFTNMHTLLTTDTVLCNIFSLSNISSSIPAILQNMTSVVIKDLLLSEWDQNNNNNNIMEHLNKQDPNFFDAAEVQDTIRAIYYDGNERDKARQYEFNGVLFAERSEVHFRHSISSSSSSSSSSQQKNHFEISNVTISNLNNISDAKSLVVQAVRFKKIISNVVNFSIHNIHVHDVYASLTKLTRPPFQNLYTRLYCVRFGFEDEDEDPVTPLSTKVHCLPSASSSCSFQISDLTIENSFVFPQQDFVFCVAQLWNTEVLYFQHFIVERVLLSTISNDENLMIGTTSADQKSYISQMKTSYTTIRRKEVNSFESNNADGDDLSVLATNSLDEIYVFTLAINEGSLIDGYNPQQGLPTATFSNDQYILIQDHTLTLAAVGTGPSARSREKLYSTVWIHSLSSPGYPPTLILNYTHVMFDNLHISHLFVEDAFLVQASDIYVLSMSSPSAPAPLQVQGSFDENNNNPLSTLPSLTVTSISLTNIKFTRGKVSMYGIYAKSDATLTGFLDVYFADFQFNNIYAWVTKDETYVSATRLVGLVSIPNNGDLELLAQTAGAPRFGRLVGGGRIKSFKFDYFSNGNNNNNNNDQIARAPSLVFRDFAFNNIHIKNDDSSIRYYAVWLLQTRRNFFVTSYENISLTDSSAVYTGTECKDGDECFVRVCAFYTFTAAINDVQTTDKPQQAIDRYNHMVASSAILSFDNIIVDNVRAEGKNFESHLDRPEVTTNLEISAIYGIFNSGDTRMYGTNFTVSNVLMSNSIATTPSIGSVRLMPVHFRSSSDTPNFYFQHVSSVHNELFADGPVFADLIFFEGSNRGTDEIADVNMFVVRDCLLKGLRATSTGIRVGAEQAITANVVVMQQHFYGHVEYCADFNNNTVLFDNLTIIDVFLNQSTDYQKYSRAKFYIEAWIFVTNNIHIVYFSDMNTLSFSRLTVFDVRILSYMYNSLDNTPFSWNPNWFRQASAGGVNFDKGIRIYRSVFGREPLTQFNIFVNDANISNIDIRGVMGAVPGVGRAVTAGCHIAMTRGLEGIRAFAVENAVMQNVYLYSETSYPWLTALVLTAPARALTAGAERPSFQDFFGLSAAQKNSIKSKLPFDSVIRIKNIIIQNSTLISPLELSIFAPETQEFSILSLMYFKRLPDDRTRVSAFVVDNVTVLDVDVVSDSLGALVSLLMMFGAPAAKSPEPRIPPSVSHDVPADDLSSPTSLLSTYGVTKLEVVVNNCVMSNIRASGTVVAETSFMFFKEYITTPFTKISATNSKIQNVTTFGSSTFVGASMALSGTVANISELYFSDIEVVNIRTAGVHKDKPVELPSLFEPLGGNQMVGLFGLDAQNAKYNDGEDPALPYHLPENSNIAANFLLIIDKITIQNINISRDLYLEYFTSGQIINYYLDPRYQKTYSTCIFFQGKGELTGSPFPMSPLPLHIKSVKLQDSSITMMKDDQTLPSLKDKITTASTISFFLQASTAKEIIIDEKLDILRNKIAFAESSKKPFSSVSMLAMKRVSSISSISSSSPAVVDIISNSISGIDSTFLFGTFVSIIFFNTTTVLPDASAHHHLAFFIDKNRLPRMLKSATIFDTSIVGDYEDSSLALKFPKFSFDIPCTTNSWNPNLMRVFQTKTIQLHQFEDTNLNCPISETRSITRSKSTSKSKTTIERKFTTTSNLLATARTAATISSFTQVSSAGAMASAVKSRAVMSSIEKIAVGKCGLSYDELNDEAPDPSVSPLQLHLGVGGGFAAGIVVGDLIVTALMMLLFIAGYWLLQTYVLSKYSNDDDDDDDDDDKDNNEDKNEPSTSKLPDWQRLIIDSKSLSMLQIVAILFFEPMMTSTLSLIAIGSEMKVIWKIICSIICIAFLAGAIFAFYKLLLDRKGTHDSFVTEKQRTPEDVTGIKFLQPVAALYLFAMEPEGSWNFDSSSSKSKSNNNNNNIGSLSDLQKKNNNSKKRLSSSSDDASSRRNKKKKLSPVERHMLLKEFFKFKLVEPILESYTNRLSWFLPVEYAVLFFGFSVSTFIAGLTGDCLPLTIIIVLSLLTHVIITIVRRPNVERLIHLGSILVSFCSIGLTIAAFILGRMYDFGGYFTIDDNNNDERKPPTGISEDDFAIALEQRNELLELIGILAMVLSCIQIPVSLLSLIGFLEAGVYQEARALYNKIMKSRNSTSSKKANTKRRRSKVDDFFNNDGEEQMMTEEMAQGGNDHLYRLRSSSSSRRGGSSRDHHHRHHHHETRSPPSSSTRRHSLPNQDDLEANLLKTRREGRRYNSSRDDAHHHHNHHYDTRTRTSSRGDSHHSHQRRHSGDRNNNYHRHSIDRMNSDMNLLRRQDVEPPRSSSSRRPSSSRNNNNNNNDDDATRRSEKQRRSKDENMNTDSRNGTGQQQRQERRLSSTSRREDDHGRTSSSRKASTNNNYARRPTDDDDRKTPRSSSSSRHRSTAGESSSSLALGVNDNRNKRRSHHDSSDFRHQPRDRPASSSSRRRQHDRGEDQLRSSMFSSRRDQMQFHDI